VPNGDRGSIASCPSQSASWTAAGFKQRAEARHGSVRAMNWRRAAVFNTTLKNHNRQGEARYEREGG
jgi:hypothetical protein